MRTQALPSDETARISALVRARILDSPPETAFDDLAQLAASLCDAPLAVITFIDRERQWFKAAVGLEVTQTARSSGLCSHTIESGEPLVVEDAQGDPRFSSHALVASEPYVRFYCGVPVVTTDGYAVGTIAVMDRVSRRRKETECLALERLARQTAALLELRMLRCDRPACGERPVHDEEMVRLMAGSSRSTGLDFLQELVETLSHSTGAAYAFCIRPLSSRRAKTVAGYGPDGPLETLEYDLTGTPCEHVLNEGFCHYPGAVQASFPQDDLLRQLSIESYMALTLPSPTGEPIGWIALLARAPLKDGGRTELLLRMAAGRAGSELVRHLAEQQLRKSEERFRAAYRNATVGMSIADLSGRIEEVNQRLCTILGYSEEELLTRTFQSLTHPDDLGQNLERIKNLMEGTAEGEVFEKRYIRKDGEIVWAQVGLSVIRDAAGHVRHTLAMVQDITERKQAEQALAHTQEKLWQALRASSTGLWDWNTETNEVFFSEEWAQQLGYTSHEIEGRFEEWQSRLHPDDHDRALAYVQNYLNNPSGPYEQEFRLCRKDGSYCWICARASFVEEPDGRKVRLLGSHTDLTERKQVERERAEALGNLQTIMKTVPDVIFVLDLEGRLSKWNLRLETVTGYTCDELLGKPALEMVPSTEAEPTSAAIRRAFESGYAELEGHLLTKDGRALRYHWTGAPFADLQGRVVGITGVGRDITERQQTEALLRSSEERFRLVAQATNDILWDWDLVTGDHWWSPNACEKFGYDPQKEPSIDAWSGRLHPEDRERVLDMVSHAIHTEISTLSAEYRFQLVDGTYGYFLDRAHIVRNEAGVAIRMIGAMIDVTGPRRAYASLEEAYRRFQAMSQELHMVESNERRRLSRELHDEVGQLLTSLKFDLTSVKRSVTGRSAGAGGWGQERLARALDTTDQLFTRLRRIVRALRPPVLEELGLKAGLEALIADVQARSRLRCALVFEQTPRRGARQPTLETAFYRIVQELLTNVIRHAHATTVSILVQQSRGEWRLTVIDDGVGFDVASLSPEGGFGLRGIRERVEILAGHVEISSRVDSGTTVQVRIPVGSTPDGTAGAGVRSVPASRRRKPVHE